MPPPAVQVTDLVVRYGSRTAVDGLSFEAPVGQVLALVGPNGGGKSTTVEVCVGLREAAAGSIELLGHHGPAVAGLRARIGVMLQDGGLYPSARPLELVRYIASLYPEPDDPAMLLERLGVDPSARTPIRRLSGGEQQRVKCALALVGRPELVFLDEPTAGLDSAGRRTFHHLVSELRDRGVTVVLTTHLMDDVERLADRIVVISHGRAIREGTLEELVGGVDTIAIQVPANTDTSGLLAALPAGVRIDEAAPGRLRVIAASDPMILAVVAGWCAEHGVPTSDLSVGRRSLEDVVVDLIKEQE